LPGQLPIPVHAGVAFIMPPVQDQTHKGTDGSAPSRMILTQKRACNSGIPAGFLKKTGYDIHDLCWNKAWGILC
jgi:hypothetical protein